MFQIVQLRAPAPPRRIAAIPYKVQPTKKRICTFDTETDPFEHGVVVKPFTCGFYDGEQYFDFWGSDCIEQFICYLNERKRENPKEELLIYCHNFGNFDAYFLTEYFDSDTSPFIMNGRIVRVSICRHEFRDSYSAIPVALAQYQKTEVDYNIFYPSERDKPLNRQIILDYQRDDCLYLYDLVSKWVEMFGTKLTMASVALPLLRSFHGFDEMTAKTDEELRPFYFGGRCQAFQTGELKGDWKIYDVNSMYPHVMATCMHPVSATPHYEKTITPRTHFAKIDAWSDGALPIRQENGSLAFPRGVNTFFACIHEIKAGLETGTLRILKTHFTIYFEVMTCFDKFIETFYEKRQQAKAEKDKVNELFYKLVMNSSYGKFAQDPRKYEKFLFDPEEMPQPLKGELEPNDPRIDKAWYLHTINSGRCIYAKSADRGEFGFFNVATAASITSAARALLLRGISRARRPIYCDTDSLICEALDMDLDDKRLGAWKLEATGDTAAIAGKKLYAVFDAGQEVKKASKGVKLSAEEIARVCRGEVIEYAHPVPKFKLSGKVEFTKRKIQRTGLAAR
jgi:hypothetical protein